MTTADALLTAPLPGFLAERLVQVYNADAKQTRDVVLYWAHHALRAHENPALDAARCLAAHLDLPLLVYQGLGGSHPYANDRHARFALESARDLRDELRALGGDLAFFAGREGESSPLPKLIKQSAVTVTDYMPVPPFDRWPKSVAGGRPLIEIDTSCLVPLTLSTKAPTRAFEFRRQFSTQRETRLSEAYPVVDVEHMWADVAKFVDSTDLDEPTDQLIHQLPCDHTVGPVADTCGGSEAGYKRWRSFCETGLARYARDRNDAALHGVSRMSAYLHYGCVSPFRIAQEAQQAQAGGSEKFLDELLIWRELAYHWAHHCFDVHSVKALPDWAVETLAEQENVDRGMSVTTWDMETARSGSALWDLAQRSLLERGELHNNVRMTWGKAIAQWSPDVNSAMRRLADLNHRYALDGSDPNSYGGLWWCLGLFDRPFKPGQGALGVVRSRSLESHEKRLDLDAYAERVRRSRSRRILVIGAGMAGVTAAHALQMNGHDVVLVEKGRGPGGRMSTRRRGALRFDHGAQYFTARDPRFSRVVALWEEQAWVQPYAGRIETVGRPHRGSEPPLRWVGSGGMNAVCKGIAGMLPEVRYGIRVAEMRPSAQGVNVLFEESDPELFDMVVCTAPAPQAATLADPETASLLSKVQMEPVWAVMLEAPGGSAPWDAAFINDDGPLSWVMSNHAKPGRASSNPYWTLHATVEWTRHHIDDEPQVVSKALIDAFADTDGVSIQRESATANAHRWLYARGSAEATGEFIDPTGRVVYCGDWARGERVEGAYLSGAAAAGIVMNSRIALGR